MLGARFLMQVNKRKGIIWRQSLFHDVEHSGYFRITRGMCSRGKRGTLNCAYQYFKKQLQN